MTNNKNATDKFNRIMSSNAGHEAYQDQYHAVHEYFYAVYSADGLASDGREQIEAAAHAFDGMTNLYALELCGFNTGADTKPRIESALAGAGYYWPDQADELVRSTNALLDLFKFDSDLVYDQPAPNNAEVIGSFWHNQGRLGGEMWLEVATEQGEPRPALDKAGMDTAHAEMLECWQYVLDNSEELPDDFADYTGEQLSQARFHFWSGFDYMYRLVGQKSKVEFLAW